MASDVADDLQPERGLPTGYAALHYGNVSGRVPECGLRHQVKRRSRDLGGSLGCASHRYTFCKARSPILATAFPVPATKKPERRHSAVREISPGVGPTSSHGLGAGFKR